MKKLFLLLFSFLIFSCNTARKTKTNIQNLEQKKDTKTESNSGTQSASGSQTSVDLSRMIDEFGLTIKGDGNQYSLNYGGLLFTGSADLELKKKTESTRIIYIYQYWDIYHHWNVTKTQEITKTNYKSKIKETEAETDSTWKYVFVFCAGMATMLLLIWFWKKYNPLGFARKILAKITKENN